MTPEGAPASAVAPEDEEPAEPTKLEVGKNQGFWQPAALLQAWALLTREDGETETTFRLRRAELRVKGEIVPKLVGYMVMIDPAKLVPFEERSIDVEYEGEVEDPGQVTVQQPGNDLSILQDFFITYISDYADVSVGQFKIPVSLEGYGSSSKILFPERSRVSRAFGDRRDIGLRVEKKIGDHFYYYAGVFNGSGQNRLDQDNEKDVGLRLEVYPVEGLTLGAVGYATVGERDENVRDRLEGDLRYEANNVLVQAEYIHGWDGAEGARTERHGAYGALGYTFIDRIQPIARVGFLNQLDTDGDQTTFYEGGVNYYLRGQEARLALTVSALNYEGDAPTTVEGILFSQVSF